MEKETGKAEQGLTKAKTDCACEWGLRENLLILILPDIRTACYDSKQANKERGLYEQLMKNKELVAFIAKHRNDQLISKRWIVKDLPLKAQSIFRGFLSDLLPNIDKVLKGFEPEIEQIDIEKLFHARFNEAIEQCQDPKSPDVYFYLAGKRTLILQIEENKDQAIKVAQSLDKKDELPVMQFIADVVNKQLTKEKIEARMGS